MWVDDRTLQVNAVSHNNHFKPSSKCNKLNEMMECLINESSKIKHNKSTEESSQKVENLNYFYIT